ncbi:hypothetical protein [Bradyrhizobium australiense]|uniref:Uncharacterized protein n=1 Tax=Bradyrhizobium australiense TaxID=2721161 RepID=A0A7Y4GU69_9BRAD|nr:hypothetical protein [Bradyrhizobium australiense]NOJ41693.1 hypothetical protein [Bradyrhizobium australiense]
MLAFGPLDRRLDTRKWIAIGGTSAIILLLAVLALFSHLPSSLHGLLLRLQ